MFTFVSSTRGQALNLQSELADARARASATMNATYIRCCTMATACLFALQTSCSYLFMRSPQYTAVRFSEPSVLAWPCDRSYTSPVLDTVSGSLQGLLAASNAGSAIHSSDSRAGDISVAAIGLGVTTAWVMSAVSGYRAVRERRTVMPDVPGLSPLRPLPLESTREAPPR